MRFSTTAGLVAFAASTVASTFESSPSDLDGSVWEGLSVKERSYDYKEQRRNRPFKRQSGWSPPSDLATPLKEVWDHCKSTYNSGNMFGFKNYGWDQLIANKGTVNMCVRWESSASLSAAERTKIASVVDAQYQKWFKWVYGYDNFPYTAVKVNVVGWAVKDKSLLQGDTSGLNIYTDTDSEGVPQCAESCGRFFHQDNNYAGCAAGASNHYDQSLWLTDGLSGGTGGDWGQRIGREYFMQAIDAEDVHILEHEMGHTYGLDDFYDWTPTGITSFIMLAGSAAKVTDFDGWMLRNWWYELSRERGWQTGVAATAAAASSVKTTSTAKATSTVKTTSVKATTTAKATSVKATTTAKATTTKATTTAKASVKTTTVKATATAVASKATASKWQQCGGATWTGATQCESGSTCTKQNDYYSQCL
ncbi:hypothetical protein BGZ61DRAFT_521192 [Ilyonectria robusta]|uniref:uncharacterized protein n=1 Tax=Ilyonectria robusta TaxID=1079257 RepID=UPI001E8EE5CA|nr:uncharacterized protein BGZ61DRAFT_521192 [Ilyonectria robusta]KAH8673142.1 hypothetical protein BGZ61DRAFT_521192 [Ilyonectria robusta]